MTEAATIPLGSKRRPGEQALAAHGPKMENNAIRNWPFIAKAQGVRAFRGACAGIPGVVIGAGPSLDLDIQLLKGLQDKCLLVCTDRALKAVLPHGIRPHIVCSADMDVDLVKLYDHLDIPSDLIMCFDRDAYHPVVAHWPGPMVTYDTAFDAHLWGRMFTGLKGFMHKNLSVGHTAYYFAALAGCSTIMLVGIDNAFPGTHTHAKGTSDVDGGVIDPAVPTWTVTKDVHGNDVRSSPGFTEYAKAFGRAIPEQRIPVINCTPIGAHIDGAPHMRFEEALKIHATETHDIKAIMKSCMALPVQPFDVERFTAHYDNIIPQLEACKRQAEFGMTQLRQAERVDRRKHPNEFARKVHKTGETMKRIAENLFIQSLIGKVMFKGQFIMEHYEESMKGLEKMDASRLWMAAARMEMFFLAERDSCEIFIEALQNVRDRVA